MPTFSDLIFLAINAPIDILNTVLDAMYAIITIATKNTPMLAPNPYVNNSKISAASIPPKKTSSQKPNADKFFFSTISAALSLNFGANHKDTSIIATEKTNDTTAL